MSWAETVLGSIDCIMDQGTVFIIDDEPVNRELFSEILLTVGIEHLCFSSAHSFLDGFDQSVPGCLLLDIRMPGMSGLELQRKLIEDGIPHPIIVVTAHGDVSVAIQAMKAGAYDFIEKPIRNQQLLEAVQGALRQGQELSDQHDIKQDLVRRFADLTPREVDVFHQVVDGEPNKRIAYHLDISIKTVELHRAKVMQKMEAHSLADLVRMSISLI